MQRRASEKPDTQRAHSASRCGRSTQLRMKETPEIGSARPRITQIEIIPARKVPTRNRESNGPVVGTTRGRRPAWEVDPCAVAPGKYAAASGAPGRAEYAAPLSGARRASLLLDDPDLDLGPDLAVQPDRHRVHAQRLDRLLQLDLAPVHLEVQPLLVQPIRDVRARDRAEQLALLAGPDPERERQVLQRRRAPPSLQVIPARPRLGPPLLLLQPPNVRRRGLERVPVRNQVIARIPRAHAHDLARLS